MADATQPAFPVVKHQPYQCDDSPADERGDDDTPGGAAAVGPGGLLALGAPAAQPEGVKEQEDQVQGQAGQSDAGQQHDGLWVGGGDTGGQR